MKETNRLRRSFLKGIGVIGGIFAIRQVHATHTDTHFEEETEHHIVYQCNKIDPDYLEHIMFSVGEMVRKYGDDIQVIVTAFGPGLHLLLFDLFSFDLDMNPLTLLWTSLGVLVVALVSQVPGLRAVRRLDVAEVVRQRTV